MSKIKIEGSTINNNGVLNLGETVAKIALLFGL
jgi:hypothetical protein